MIIKIPFGWNSSLCTRVTLLKAN